MNVLITGAAGFIGSHVAENLFFDKKIKKIFLIDHLQDGEKKNILSVLKKKKVKFFKIDISKKNSFNKLKKFKIDNIIHLAAISDIVPSIANPYEYIFNNYVGTLNLLKFMLEKKIKKISYAASSSCYGLPRKFPTDEKSKIDCKYPYAYSKYACEELINHFSKVYGIRYISLRLFNVYGTRSRTNSAYGAAIGVFMKQKLENKPFTIVGDGKQKRDFIYVTDVAEAFKKSLYLKSNKIINIGSQKPISINKITKLLKGKKIFIPKRPGEPSITHASISLAKKVLNWRPIINIEKGLEMVIKNKSYWKKAPLWTPSKIKKATEIWFKYLK